MTAASHLIRPRMVTSSAPPVSQSPSDTDKETRYNSNQIKIHLSSGIKHHQKSYRELYSIIELLKQNMNTGLTVSRNLFT